MQKNLTKISALKSQTMGSPLTHSNPVSKALTTGFEHQLTLLDIKTGTVEG
jgi:hypothetical protein